MAARRLWGVLLALVLAVLPLSGAGAFQNVSPVAAWKPPGTLLAYEPMTLPGVFRAKAWRILYATRDFLGRPTLSSGMVVMSGYAPADPRQRRIVAWAHQTSGIARKCAPSQKSDGINSILGISDLVAGGYIVAASDYPGLGTDGQVGYLVGKGQANAVIDSVRAARQIPGVGGGNRYALWGYSQGGHAALFASLFDSSYAPELNLVGVAAVSPPTNLSLLMRTGLDSIEGHIFGSYIVGSWTKKYGISDAALTDPDVRPVIDKINLRCVNKTSDLLKILKQEKGLREKFLQRSPMDIPEWRTAVTLNSISSLSGRIPTIIFQGSSDTIVNPAVTSAIVQESCRYGATAKYVILPGAGHSGAAKASVTQAVNWITDRFAGRPAPSSCR
ncbi:MAG: alpha/beta fold hydrolase [Hyphomicrobiales bacterium]